MNKVILSGNLVKDMEVKVLGELVVGNMIIANNRGYGEKQKTSFVRCTIFGEKRVKALEKLLVKGVGVLIEGELDITTKEFEDGFETYTNVIVNELEITRFKKDEEKEEDKPKARRRK